MRRLLRAAFAIHERVNGPAFGEQHIAALHGAGDLHADAFHLGEGGGNGEDILELGGALVMADGLETLELL